MRRPLAFVASVVLYVVVPGPWEWLFFVAALGILVSWVGTSPGGNHPPHTGVEPDGPT